MTGERKAAMLGCSQANHPAAPALPAAQDMGVIEELKAADEVRFADNGGFVSPSGLSYIGALHACLGGFTCELSPGRRARRQAHRC